MGWGTNHRVTWPQKRPQVPNSLRLRYYLLRGNTFFLIIWKFHTHVKIVIPREKNVGKYCIYIHTLTHLSTLQNTSLCSDLSVLEAEFL